ncbi:MAG TPA: ABC transporter permease [Pseudonocardiaceae bacterium]|nr:ABC transporter permease [Pseudonocardiaceae bacterium]
MIRFLLRRLVNYVVLCLLAVLFTYVLASLSFDPIALIKAHKPPPSASTIADKIHDLHLDQAIPVRFGNWFAAVLHGDFGNTVYGNPITPDVWERAGVSLRLFLFGTIFAVVLGVLVGVSGAIRQYRFSDYATTFLSYILIATPVFVLGTLLKFGATELNYFTGSNFLQFTGEVTPGFTGSFGAELWDRFRHLILPTIAIGLGPAGAAYYSRYQRNAMLDVLGADFLRTAAAKGLRRRRVIYRHGLRVALIPMAALFTFGFATMIVGGPFTERIFGWNGMGDWLVDGIETQDANLTATVTLFLAVCVLVSGLLADLAYAALDPRIRI